MDKIQYFATNPSRCVLPCYASFLSNSFSNSLLGPATALPIQSESSAVRRRLGSPYTRNSFNVAEGITNFYAEQYNLPPSFRPSRREFGDDVSALGHSLKEILDRFSKWIFLELMSSGLPSAIQGRQLPLSRDSQLPWVIASASAAMLLSKTGIPLS